MTEPKIITEPAPSEGTDYNKKFEEALDRVKALNTGTEPTPQQPAPVEEKPNEYERRLAFARQKAVGIWTMPGMSNIPFDQGLAEVFAHVLVEEMYAPHLGCATTEELFEELKSRADLTYRTIDGD